MRNRAASPACADGRHSSPVTPRPARMEGTVAEAFRLCGYRSRTVLVGRSLSGLSQCALNSALGIAPPWSLVLPVCNTPSGNLTGSRAKAGPDLRNARSTSLGTLMRSAR
jgi:hypothetical protein